MVLLMGRAVSYRLLSPTSIRRPTRT